MATLKVKNTFISIELEGDMAGPGAGAAKKPGATLVRSRSQGNLGEQSAESLQIEKLNRIVGSDMESLRMLKSELRQEGVPGGRSPAKTSTGTATPKSSDGQESTSESAEYAGWIELGSYGALPGNKKPTGWVPRANTPSESELLQLKEKLEKCCLPQSAADAMEVACKSMDRKSSNGSVSTMTSFEANRSRACSNGSITDCWTEDARDEPVEFDLTIEEEPSHPWKEPEKKKWRPRELGTSRGGSSRTSSGSSWDSASEACYGQTSWYQVENTNAPMHYGGSPFSTPTPSPSQWMQDKCYGYKDKAPRGLPRESRHNRVPKNVNLQAEFQSQSKEITTLMIRNIPNRYTQRELMVELEELGFANKFDFLYSPLDKGTMSNVGYAFVNFKTAEWASHCMQAFQNYRFKRHRKTSGKVAAVSAAHLQGLEANLAHYEKTAVNTAKMKQRRPVVLAAISSSLASPL